MKSPFPDVPTDRVLSIDALRGFDMFWIIGGGTLVIRLFEWLNLPFTGTVVAQMEHSAWNGFTFEDLIFPLFLFIMGVSIPFALTKRLQRGEPKGSLHIRIFKRFALLFFLGLVYNGLLNFNFADMRYVGVLQRIALCYLAASVIFINTGIRGQAIWTGAILFGYWALMALVPVPGFGAGVLTPEGNLASWVDRLVLPGRFCCFEYGDNEGLLSTIPAVATALLGVLASHWLRSNRTPNAKTIGLLAAGCLGLGAALIWDLVFPINKLLWTSSYVLLAGGWSLLLLAVFYWIIDVRGWRSWSFPFVVVGMNAIAIYLLSGMVNFNQLVDPFIRGLAGLTGDFRPVFVVSSALIAKWILLWFLYKQKIFLRA